MSKRGDCQGQRPPQRTHAACLRTNRVLHPYWFVLPHDADVIEWDAN